jgi:uncharacterized protein YbgA (DUF1722 family)
MRIFRPWLLGGLVWLSWAQTPSRKDTLPPIDSAITPFEVHQEAILKLVAYHEPHLRRLDTLLTAYRDTLNSMIAIAQYPKRLPFYVDSFRVVTSRIRANTEHIYHHLKDFHYEWLPHQYALMAVWTRYGELKVINRLTPSVRETLVQYRRYLDLMMKLNKKIADIWTDCDYLLLSKLK